VWGAPERNPWASIGGRLLVERGHLPPPEPGAPGVFAMASEERTRSLLDRAGFTEVRTEEVPVRFEIPSIDEYLAVIADTAGSIALAVRGLPEAARDAVKVQAEATLERFARADGYQIPGVVLCVVAS
jgi:hypothetical protein